MENKANRSKDSRLALTSWHELILLNPNQSRGRLHLSRNFFRRSWLTYICASDCGAEGVSPPLAPLFHLIDMPDHQRHRWTGWLSFSAAVPLMHFISSPGSLLVWLRTRCSDTWQEGFGLIATLALFFIRRGGIYYNIYIIYKITGKGYIMQLCLKAKLSSV